MSVLRDSLASDQLREGSFNDDFKVPDIEVPATTLSPSDIEVSGPRYDTVEVHIRYETVETKF